jgi:PAS domain S-box-containing protein
MRHFVSERLLRVFTWALIGSGGLACLLEFELVPGRFLATVRQLQHLHLPFLLLLLAAGAVLYGSIRLAAAKSAAHAQAVTGLQQEIDKTAWRYKCLLEGAGNAIYVFNAETGILEEVNRRGTELLGYTREEMATLHGAQLIQPGEQERFSALVLRVKRRGRGRSPGIAFRRKDGQLLIAEIDARLIDLGDEKVVHVIVRDVTYRHHTQREIRRRNQELVILNNILAQANQSLQLQTVLDVTLREAGDFIAANGAVLHLMTDEGQALHMTAGQNITAELAAALKLLRFTPEADCRLTQDGGCHDGNLGDSASCGVARVAAAAGWRGWVAIPLRGNNRLIGIMHLFSQQERQSSEEDRAFFLTLGQQIGMVIGQARLFTELNWKNEELRRSYSLLEKSSRQLEVSQSRLRKNLELVERANLELERLDRMKSQFLGVISHEFRTPLTSLLGSADLLRVASEQMTGEERQRLLEMIYHGGGRLNEIVNDLMKVAHLEAKSAPITRTSVQLATILEGLQEQLQPVLTNRQQTLLVGNMSSLPLLHADQEFLEDIFAELLENAIKFTPDGGEIRITAQVADCRALAAKRETLERFNAGFYAQMGPHQYLLVEVCDNGIGIDTAEQQHIFEKFYELGDICNHYTSKFKFQGKGAGLGLAIVKGMAEAHGGMVWVESRTDGSRQQGSSFLLLFPLGDGATQRNLPFIGADEPGVGAAPDKDTLDMPLPSVLMV